MKLSAQRAREVGASAAFAIGAMSFMIWGAMENSIVVDFPREPIESSGNVIPYPGSKGVLVYLTRNELLLVNWTRWISYAMAALFIVLYWFEKVRKPKSAQR